MQRGLEPEDENRRDLALEGASFPPRIRGDPAGLRTCRRASLRWISTGRGFPAQNGTSAWSAAFVPAYRCGAVPDLDRIPSCDGQQNAARTGFTDSIAFRAVDAVREHSRNS